MSQLPERKKSAGEIARLRETIGVPGMANDPDPARIQPSITPIPTASTQRAAAPAPETSELAPLLPVQPAGTRSVRSLRKSEQIPLPPAHHAESPPDSVLPHHRHSAEEIEEIRRREAFALLDAKPNPRLSAAHPALIVPGYLCAAAGAVGFYFYEFPMAATAACVAAALMVAAFIRIRKPVSRHHAAFIAVLALFVIVFGALHYFPHLRHAT